MMDNNDKSTKRKMLLSIIAIIGLLVYFVVSRFFIKTNIPDIYYQDTQNVVVVEDESTTEEVLEGFNEEEINAGNVVKEDFYVSNTECLFSYLTVNELELVKGFLSSYYSIYYQTDSCVIYPSSIVENDLGLIFSCSTGDNSSIEKITINTVDNYSISIE